MYRPPQRRTGPNDISRASTSQTPRSQTRWTAPNPMELLASVSRSGGDGAEGDALKDHSTQQKFHNYILERLDKHYALHRTSRDAPPSSLEERESLSSIVLLYRKLREGVVASHRIDAFAVKVFEESVLLAILAGNTPQFVSSVNGLVPGLYTALDDRKGKSKAVDNDPLDLSNLSIDNRSHFASLLLLHHLLTPAFDDLLRQLTTLPGTTTSRARPFTNRTALVHVITASQALSPHTFSSLKYFDLLSSSSGLSNYERAVLGKQTDRVREMAWVILKKVYLEAGEVWAASWLGLREEELGGYVAAKNANIEGGKVKLR